MPGEAAELCEAVGEAGRRTVPADGLVPAEATDLYKAVGDAAQTGVKPTLAFCCASVCASNCMAL